MKTWQLLRKLYQFQHLKDSTTPGNPYQFIKKPPGVQNNHLFSAFQIDHRGGKVYNRSLEQRHKHETPKNGGFNDHPETGIQIPR
jgi:hypothetical protein